MTENSDFGGMLSMGRREKLGVVSGVTATTGAALNAAGIYALPHAATGATMLGSTAAGSSAAGTVGFIAGTHGIVGAVGATLIAPPIIVATGCIAAAIFLPKAYRMLRSR